MSEILIIDDDIIIQEILKTYLDGEGHTIIVTAVQDKEHLSQGLDAGADDFLAKPVNALELRTRVRSLRRIKRQYDELEALVNLRADLSNMVVLAKMEAGKLALDKSTSNINQLATDIASGYQEVADARNIRLIVDTTATPCDITLGHHLISRVLDNLLSNALKFSTENDEVSIKTRCVEREGLHWGIFEIADHGPGIAPEHRNSIFDKFGIVKLKNQNVQPTSLGLAFCKLVVEAHHGTIYVRTNTPQGSIFGFEVPNDR